MVLHDNAYSELIFDENVQGKAFVLSGSKAGGEWSSIHSPKHMDWQERVLVSALETNRW